jgi:diguanylate cyclase (GGDEF)-like protein
MKTLLILLFFALFSYGTEINQIDLSKVQWEYKWGDSPFENEIPLWTYEKEDDKSWQSIDFPSNPPDRNNQTNVWYRVKLPDILPNDPNLYIVSVDLIAEVYIDNKRIYHFGEFDENGKGKFIGWPWHLIPLGDDYAGKYLYFRVYSDYGDIGLWGEILLTSKGELLEKMLSFDINKVIIGSISIFVSLLFLLSFIARFKNIELSILGLLFLTQGLNVLLSTKIIEIYFYYPLLKQYILAIAFFFFPVGMALFMDKSIQAKVPFNIVRKIWQIHLIYLLVAVFGSILGFFTLPSTYEFFDIFYNFVTLPFLTIFMVYFFFKGNKETKIITFSFFIISLYWIYSTLIAAGLVPWEEYPADVAVFLCLILLSYSMVDKLNYTRELEEAKEELTKLSITDYLTNLYNRKEIDIILNNYESMFKRYGDAFSIILLDLDNFKNINDTYGHLIGDKVLIEIADILRTMTRKTDIVGRWGGEEFIIICPKTDSGEAFILAEKLREKISSYNFETVGNESASFGVTTYKENDSLSEFLSRADDAMYIAKTKGKNQVEMKL